MACKDRENQNPPFHEICSCLFLYEVNNFFYTSPTIQIPMGLPSHGGDVVIYVMDINQLSLATPFFFCSYVCFCLSGPFNCISFHKLS